VCLTFLHFFLRLTQTNTEEEVVEEAPAPAADGKEDPTKIAKKVGKKQYL
jgi:hypothetical protein